MTDKTENRIFIGVIALVLLVFASTFVLPHFLTRNHRHTWAMAMIYDGRTLGNAAQQYFLSTGEKSVSFTYDSITGEITGPLATWVKAIGKGYTIPDTTIESGNPAAFTLSHTNFRNGQSVTFSDEGKTTLDPAR